MRIITTIVFFLYASIANAAGKAETFYTWVELSPQSIPIARAIVEKTKPCPSIIVDKKKYRMQVRAEANTAFSVRSCEYALPKKAQKVFVRNKALPVLPKKLNRIVIIGDTGCRLKGDAIQACDQPTEWPFAQIAKHIADLKPDLVIHTGDYHYRETKDWGYDWRAWEADFFKPAKPLLASTPWIMVRGNHEECARAGEGWRRFLDPYAFGSACTDYSSPYKVKIANQKFLVFDSAAALLHVKKSQKKIYQAQFQTVRKMAEGNTPAWLLVHHPVWAVYQTQMGPFISNTDSLQAGIGSSGLLSSIKLIASGHLHLVGWLQFNKDDLPARPPQLIAGHSGSQLIDHFIDFSTFKGKKLDGQIVQDGWSRNGFGYLLATRKGNRWIITDHRIDGSVVNQFEVF
jgi:hypothetical protein